MLLRKSKEAIISYLKKLGNIIRILSKYYVVDKGKKS